MVGSTVNAYRRLTDAFILQPTTFVVVHARHGRRFTAIKPAATSAAALDTSPLYSNCYNHVWPVSSLHIRRSPTLDGHRGCQTIERIWVCSLFIPFGPHETHCKYRPNTQNIGDETMRSVATSYLKVGETVFDMIQGTAVNSQYFKRDDTRR